VVIYDDDHYYMGGALAERLRKQGLEVHLITPSVKVSEFTDMTMEQHRIQSGLLKLGVQIHTNLALAGASAIAGGLSLELAHVYSDVHSVQECASLVMVTMRDPNDALFTALQAQQAHWQSKRVKSIQLLGDAYAPGTVAAAVYAGHRAARALDAPALALDAVPFKREMIDLRPA
jgi:dimethylamine/trimethylamine dehydrogenase